MAPPHQHFELAESAMRLQIAHAMPPLGKQVAHLLHEVALVLGDVAFEFLPRPHHDFCRGRRRGGAHVRHKIGNREIGLVADAA